MDSGTTGLLALVAVVLGAIFIPKAIPRIAKAVGGWKTWVETGKKEAEIEAAKVGTLPPAPSPD